MAFPISKQLADDLYDKAGTLIPEDPEEITIEKYNYLIKDSVHLIIQEVLTENPLPFKLQDFQLITLHCLGSLKNVILVSPNAIIAATLQVSCKEKWLHILEELQGGMCNYFLVF